MPDCPGDFLVFYSCSMTSPAYRFPILLPKVEPVFFPDKHLARVSRNSMRIKKTAQERQCEIELVERRSAPSLLSLFPLPVSGIQIDYRNDRQHKQGYANEHKNGFFHPTPPRS